MKGESERKAYSNPARQHDPYGESTECRHGVGKVHLTASDSA